MYFELFIIHVSIEWTLAAERFCGHPGQPYAGRPLDYGHGLFFPDGQQVGFACLDRDLFLVPRSGTVRTCARGHWKGHSDSKCLINVSNQVSFDKVSVLAQNAKTDIGNFTLFKGDQLLVSFVNNTKNIGHFELLSTLETEDELSVPFELFSEKCALIEHSRTFLDGRDVIAFVKVTDHHNLWMTTFQCNLTDNSTPMEGH
ncbi:hypothetical protein HDE_05852 [Halotydeus destructor]|nr:hypothetical protein HDE_05852 [Halotydeus destructor]